MSEATDGPGLRELRERMKRLDEEFDRLRHAYYRRASVQGRIPDYDELKALAERFIRANHEYQKARYGRIRLRLSVSKLLR
jgi:hypothetical protein